jgi:glutamine---fructose-6-phosphate transaminase (isomerizing)
VSAVSPYEVNIAEQPEALRDVAQRPLSRALESIDLDSFERIILTGMGASHFAAIPTWRRLVERGYPAWWLSTSELLDSPTLVSANTLLWVTSQSGRSGEIVAIFDSLRGCRPRITLGVTNDLTSPLAQECNFVVDLYSGEEATVSSKSYMNSLAAHHLIVDKLTGVSADESVRTVLSAAEELERWTAPVDFLRSVATSTVAEVSPRMALIGTGNQAATALMGALIIKEAAKLGAEGFVGGEFRHGPLEMAGSGLTAVLYTGRAEQQHLRQLGSELVASGSHVIELGSTNAEPIYLEASSELSHMLLETKFTQLLSVELARAQGITPGEFRFGKKITSSL